MPKYPPRSSTCRRMDVRWVARSRPQTFGNPRALDAYLRGVCEMRRFGRRGA